MARPVRFALDHLISSAGGIRRCRVSIFRQDIWNHRRDPAGRERLYPGNLCHAAL